MPPGHWQSGKGWDSPSMMHGEASKDSKKMDFVRFNEVLIWELVTDWRDSDSPISCWSHIITIPNTHHMAIRTLVLLVAWEVWNERNSRTKKLEDKIKEEVSTWVIEALNG